MPATSRASPALPGARRNTRPASNKPYALSAAVEVALQRLEKPTDQGGPHHIEGLGNRVEQPEWCAIAERLFTCAGRRNEIDDLLIIAGCERAASRFKNVRRSPGTQRSLRRSQRRSQGKAIEAPECGRLLQSRSSSIESKTPTWRNNGDRRPDTASSVISPW
jgi:hypothetical protein